MARLSIRKLTVYGFLILIIGALVGGVTLIHLIFKYEAIEANQQVVKDAYDSIFALKYNTERLLTTPDLPKQQKIWEENAETFDVKFKILTKAMPEQAEKAKQFWQVAQAEIKNVSAQLKSPLFSEKNVMEKSLLRRLGEGFNANETSEYYVSTRTLTDLIDYLNQYEDFVLDELFELNALYRIEGNHRLRATQNLLILTPISTFLMLVILAAILFILIRRVETELKKQSEAVRQSMTNIVITDLDGAIEYVNPSFLKRTGYTLKEIIGNNPRLLKSGKTDPRVYSDLWETLLAGGVWEGEFCNRRKNGELYWERAVISPIQNDRGQTTNFVAVKQDITEKKHQEDELKVALSKAKKASNAKSDFLASMSHDLRTPLNAVLGYADMIREKTFGPVGNRNYEDYIENIYFAGQQLLSLINDILDLSKIESEEFHLNETEVNLSHLIRFVIKSFEPQLNERSLKFDFKNSLPAPWILADERALTQIFNNLISNAIKFTPDEGHVTISYLEQENDALSIRIQDTGQGIPENILEMIAEPFITGNPGIADDQHGTGLGLYICQRLVKLHGGIINIESQVGYGTTITIELPAKRRLKKE